MATSPDAPAEDHRRKADRAHQRSAIRCSILTISDSRSIEEDRSGDAVVSLLEEAGYSLGDRRIVRDETAEINSTLQEWIADLSVSVIITTGGTGLARRDNTVSIVESMLTTTIEGFGELFRWLSYQEIGSAAMLSRATAGLVTRSAEDGGDTFVFALPGSTNAVRLAVSALIVPELPHLVWQRRKSS